MSLNCVNLNQLEVAQLFLCFGGDIQLVCGDGRTTFELSSGTVFGIRYVNGNIWDSIV